LQAVEDREIITLIRRQQDVGLAAVTDGEYCRASWQTDFLVALEGVESYQTGVELTGARRGGPLP
jgi:5-methyltetrahydropteroyltriglutamate--homocysteine methyltransferase